MISLALISIAAMRFNVSADEKHAVKKDAAKNASFEKIKSLSGTWEVTPKPGESLEGNAHSGTVNYKVTAGGSAVMETVFPGTDHEMVTLFFMEGDELALTHYCVLQNRPHMHAQPSSKSDRIVFKCEDEENAGIEAEDHMHQATFTFVDADHLKTEWVLYKDGKADSSHSFNLTRKKS
jgi:hypothetical protein